MFQGKKGYSFSIGCLSLLWMLSATTSWAQHSNPSLKWAWKMKGKQLQIHVSPAPKGTTSLLGLLKLPMKPAQVVRWGHYLYLAARRAGLLVVSVHDPTKPQIVGQQARGHDVIGLRLEGTLLVLEIAHYKFKVLSLSQPGKPTALLSRGVPSPGILASPKTGRPSQPIVAIRPKVAKQPPPAQAKTRSSNRDDSRDSRLNLKGAIILRVRAGFVLINKGSKHGLQVGDRIAIRDHRPVLKYDPRVDREVKTPSRRITAVIVLNKVYPNKASGRLGRGDSAHPQDYVEATDRRLTHRLFFPERVGGYWRFETSLSPILGITSSQASFGLISFLTMSYAFEAPFRISVGINPFTAVVGPFSPAASGNFLLQIGYDTSYIELMLGIGYQAVTGGRSGVVFMQGIRLGATDGLHLRFHSQLVLVPIVAGSSQLRFLVGAMYGDINIPLSSRVTLFFEGGGGSVDWFHAQAGVRTYLWGRGGGNTLILSGGAGAAGVSPFTTDIQRSQAVGPMVSIAIDWRF